MKLFSKSYHMEKLTCESNFHRENSLLSFTSHQMGENLLMSRIRWGNFLPRPFKWEKFYPHTSLSNFCKIPMVFVRSLAS